MPHTKTKTVAKSHKHSHAQRPVADFLALLADAEHLEDETRQFWLTNYDRLDMRDQKELARTLLDANKEITKENEHHIGRVAEINAKCTTRLRRLTKHNKNLTSVAVDELSETSTKPNDDLLDDELLHQLEAAGEL